MENEDNLEVNIKMWLIWLNHENLQGEALINLVKTGDRRAVPAIIKQAKKNKDNIKLFYALTAFNCEEYLLELLDISMNSDLLSKIYMLEILNKIEGINEKLKKILISSLILKKQLIKGEVNISMQDFNYITDCINIIEEIPVEESAKIIEFKKK